MSRVFDVAAREFRHTVMTKAFLMAAVFFPVLVWGMAILLPSLLHAPPTPLVGRLAVFAPSTGVVDAIRAEFDPARVEEENARKLHELEGLLAQPLPAAFRDKLQEHLKELAETPAPKVDVVAVGQADDIEALKAETRAGGYVGIARLEPGVLGSDPAGNQFDLYLSTQVTRKHADLLKDSLARAVVRARASAAKIDLAQMEALVAEPTVITTTLTLEGGEARENEMLRVFVPFAFMLLLWMSTMMTGNYLLTSTIEEKGTKVIEVLLSAVSPLELMAGKILGQCLVGLLMIGLYAGLGGAAARQLDYAHLVPPEKLAFLVLYFLMAFFMVASVMAAIGSAVNELREAQSLLGPATLVFMIPFLAWFFISDNPNSTFATVISFIPPITPFAMILRVTAVESVPMWQIVSTTLLGFAAVFAMVWMSSRVFRVGVLMYGKPPSLGELLKWVRYS